MFEAEMLWYITIQNIIKGMCWNISIIFTIFTQVFNATITCGHKVYKSTSSMGSSDTEPCSLYQLWWNILM